MGLIFLDTAVAITRTAAAGARKESVSGGGAPREQLGPLGLLDPLVLLGQLDPLDPRELLGQLA